MSLKSPEKSKRRWLGLFALVAIIGLVVSCVATPMPEPPNLDPPDLELITGHNIVDVREPHIRLEGEPGAAPPGSTLWSVNFDWWALPTTTVVAEDGSFELEVIGFDGSEARIQTRTAELRSTPLDVILRENGSPELLNFEPCLQLTPSFELDLGEVPTHEIADDVVVLHNGCASDLEVAIPPLYLGETAFVIETGSPIVVPAQEETEVEISFHPEADGYFEEILLLEITGSIEERRPVTLFGQTAE